MNTLHNAHVADYAWHQCIRGGTYVNFEEAEWAYALEIDSAKDYAAAVDAEFWNDAVAVHEYFASTNTVIGE